MDKIWRIARTEYLNSIRSKAFLIGVIMLPVFMFGGIIMQRLARNKVDLSPRRIAVVDQSGKYFATIATKAREHNEHEIFDWHDGKMGGQIRPAFLPEEYHAKSSDEQSLDLVLSEQVRQKKIFAFLIIGGSIESSGGGRDADLSYYTETPAFVDLPDWLERVMTEEIQRRRFQSAQLDEKLIRQLTRPVLVKKLGLAKKGATGEVIKAKENNQMATFLLPFGSMFLLFMLVMSSAPNLLNSVLEEKMQKIAEVLISSVSPFQLMLGKLLGAVLVSMTLSLLYLGSLAAASVKFHFAEFIPVPLYFWFILFQLLAFFIFGSIFIAVGAACNEIRDAQSMMFPAMLLVMIPMFVWMPVMQSPSSPFSRAISLFPPATPMLMLLRIASKPGPPWWEIILSIVLTTAFMLGCVWVAAKIFRIGILAQGQPPSFRRMLSWVLSRS